MTTQKITKSTLAYEDLTLEEQESLRPKNKLTSLSLSLEDLSLEEQESLRLKEFNESILNTKLKALKEERIAANKIEDEKEKPPVEKALGRKPTWRDLYPTPIPTSKEVGDFGTDLKRIGLRHATSLTTLLAMAGGNRLPESTQKRLAGNTARNMVTNLSSGEIEKDAVDAFLNLTGQEKKDLPNTIDQETGRIQQLETIGGMVADASIFMASGWRMAAGQSPAMAVASWELAAQLFVDSNNNMFNAIQDAVDNNDGEQTDGELILDMLVADPDDSPLKNRTKLLAEGLGIGLLFKAVTAIPAAYKAVRGGKDPSEMTADELAEVIADYGVNHVTRKEVPQPNSAYGTDTDEGVKQIIDQAVEGKTGIGKVTARLKQLQQKYVITRGYSSRLLFKAMLDSQYTQRSIISSAEHIGARVRATYDLGELEANRLNELLRSDITDVLKLNPEDRIDFLARQQNISTQSSEAFLEARYAIDELSTEIGNTPGFSKEVKESVIGHLGQYLRRSFRLFEESDYVPSTAATEKLENSIASDFVQREIAKAAEDGIQLTTEEIGVLGTKGISAAKKETRSLLSKAPDELRDFVFQSKRVNSIYKRKELSEEMLEFLGEIKDPSENIILSMTKAVRMLEMQKFYNQVRKLGQNRYIFKTEDEAIEASLELGFKKNIFSNKIGKIKAGDESLQGERQVSTNSALDGMWTTPEIVRVLRRDEDTFKYLENNDAAAYAGRLYSGQKGVAQGMQTVYHHITAARNVIGGYQFGVANGRVFSHLMADNQFKVLKSKVFNKAGTGIEDKLLKDSYEDYLQLGVINTSVSLNQYRELLETGFRNGSPFKLLNKSDTLRPVVQTVTGSRPYKFLKDAAIDKPQEIYMATDDYFKIGTFEAELAVLKRATPNADEAVLRQEAALITRNTLPNYDQIPKGIKQLRNTPIGNFVAFPAEMLRTSLHIVKQGVKEVTSNNAVLRDRGLQRLAGFTAVNAGWGAAAYYSASMLGLTEQDREDLNHLGSGPYSTGRDTIYFRDGDGELMGIDTQYLNSYYGVTAFVREAYSELTTGRLQGKALQDASLDAVIEGVRVFLSPYVTSSIATEPVLDIATALYSDDGKDTKGRRLVTEKNGLDLERVAKMLGKVYLPGSLTAVSKLSDAIEGVPNEYTLEYQDEGYAWLAQAGWKATSYSKMALAAKFDDLIGDYTTAESKNSMDRVRFSNVDKVVQDYLDVNDKRLQNQQDLYLTIKTSERQLGVPATIELLERSGIPKLDYLRITTGSFQPESVEAINNIFETEQRNMFKFKTREEQQAYKGELLQAREDVLFMKQQMMNVKLNNYGGFKEQEWLNNSPSSKREQRLSRAGGGEVSTKVPNAPSEPDERINKLTGVPYNEGAGAAYMDEDDPMRVLKMNLGGVVPELSTSDPMGVKSSNRESAKVVADVVTDTLPIVGEVKGAIDTVKSIREGDYTGAAVNAGATLLGIVPGVGDAAGRVLKTKRKKLETLINKLKTSLSERTEVDTPIRPVPPRQLDEANKDYDERVSLALKTQGVDVSEKLKTGGEYVDPRTNKPLTNRVVSNSVIAPFTQERPVFQGVLQDYSSNTKMLEGVRKEAVKKNSDITILKSNLLKNNKYKIVSEDIEGLQDHTDRFGIVTVVGKNTLKYKKDRGMESDHMYGLQVEVKGDAVLERKVTKDKNNKYGYAQPSLKPHFVGDMKQGNKVGEIKMQGKIHPLYDVIRVDAESLSSKTTKAQGGAIETQLIVFDAELLAEE